MGKIQDWAKFIEEQRQSAQNANFWGAGFYKAILRSANLSNVSMGYANLIDTEFRCADLTEANLEGANLRGESGTNLKWTIFEEANLKDIYMNWDSQALIAERLRQAAGTVPKLKGKPNE